MTTMSGSTPTVTVLMSAYHEPVGIVKKAVCSILDQTYADLEFIILLDDPENMQLRTALERLADADPRIRLHVNPSNLGLTASLNKGIGLARGAYICRMDADDVSLPSRVESQLSDLETRDLDLVGGRMLVIDDDGNELYEIPQPPVTPEAVKRALAWNNCVPHPSWFGKAEVFAGGYRAIPLCEDYDFLIRAVLAGKRVGNCTDVVLKYRMSSSSLSRDNLYEQFLYQRFLTKEYRAGKVVDPEAARSYVEGRGSARAARRYSVANERFNKTLSYMSERSMGRFICSALKTGFTSITYDEKIFRLVMASLLAR